VQWREGETFSFKDSFEHLSNGGTTHQMHP
jgi:hypothetical protein